MDPLLKLVSDPPPISTTIHHPGFEMDTLKKVIRAKWKVKSKFEDVKKDLGIITEELKLLSHILFKNHNRFRNDKGYKDLRMLEKTLQKFLSHKFMKSLADLLGFIPDSASSQLKTYLPTPAMGHHTHLQLYGAAAFLERIEMLSKNCALLDVQRLNLGHFWGVSAQNLAVVGRIWLVCRHLLVRIQTFYSGMGQVVAELPGDKFGSELPENLFNFMPDDMVEQVKQAEATIVDVETGVEVKEQIVTVEDFLDLGVPIKRPAEPSLFALNKKRKKVESSVIEEETKPTESKDILSDIHSIDQLKEFLKLETELRKSSRKTSLTRKLNQEDWKALKTNVVANMVATKPNKSLKLCRKLIRNAIK